MSLELAVAICNDFSVDDVNNGIFTKKLCNKNKTTKISNATVNGGDI